MKTITKLAIGLVALASSNTFAATMQCYVDTPAWDYYTNNSCFATGSATTTSANFKLTDLDGEVNKVFWSGDGASACSSSSTQCSVPIRNRGRSIRLTADILYTNGTYQTASATAVYEGYF